MQFHDYVSQEIKFGDQVAGFPLTTYLQNEKTKLRSIIGGNPNIDIVDEYKRFDGLVIPMGLYTQHYADDSTVPSKRVTYKTIADDLFDDLFTMVAKPVRRANRTMKMKPVTQNKYTRRK
jgi:hypothetical protein